MTFDIAIIGSGPAGLSALHQIQSKSPDKKVALFELGRPPGKRRRQIEGWMGAVPFGDGKLWRGDGDKVFDRIQNPKCYDLLDFYWEKSIELLKCKFSKENLPQQGMLKKISQLGFRLQNDSYLQAKPEQFHFLSKFLVENLENYSNLNSFYDTEVTKIEKSTSGFSIQTNKENVVAEKVLIASGRSGWRWSAELISLFDQSSSDTLAKIGVFLEFPAQHLKEFNKSNCKLFKNNFEVGPFLWHGSIIPEDHADLIISAFRSNEERWKSEKVAFPVIQNFNIPGGGIKETTRLAQLALLLSNDRVSREKIKIFLKNQSQLNLLPEFQGLHEIFADLETLISDFGSRGYFHAPYLQTIAPKFNLSTTCQSDVAGLYFAGESAGVQGILSAVIMGHLAGEELAA